MRRRRHCHCFLWKETVVAIATVADDVGSQQCQWWGQATAMETEAAVGAHNNQPTNEKNGSRNGVRGGCSGNGSNGGNGGNGDNGGGTDSGSGEGGA